MDAVWLPPAAPVAQRQRTTNPAVLGLLVGAAVPALVASAAWWLDIPWVAAVSGAGIVVGALIGAAAADALIGPGWVAATVLAALAAPLVPGGVVAFGLLAAAGSTPDVGTMGVVVMVAFSGLVLFYAEVVGAPITLPLAFLVAILVRRAARMPGDRGLWHVLALVVAAAAFGAVTLVVMTGLLLPFGIGRIDTGY